MAPEFVITVPVLRKASTLLKTAIMDGIERQLEINDPEINI